MNPLCKRNLLPMKAVLSVTVCVSASLCTQMRQIKVQTVLIS